MSELVLRNVEYGHPDAVALIEQVQAEYVIRYGSPDETPVEEAMFAAPDGTFLVGYLDDEPIATGAWRATSVESFGIAPFAEIKRMYVVPTRRRQGLARLVLGALEKSARQHGYRTLILETGLAQPEAIAMYTAAGYEPIEPFGHYRNEPLCRCFGRVLVSD